MLVMPSYGRGANRPARTVSGPNHHAGRDDRDCYSRWDEDRETTRYLSARALLSIGYAEDIVTKVINDDVHALAPDYGVNIAVVAKWALRSLRLRRQRDEVLSLLLIIGVLVSVLVPLFAAGPLIVILISATFAAVSVVAWHRVRVEYLARMKLVDTYMRRGRFDGSTAPESPVPWEQDRLNVVSSGRTRNLIVFSGHEAFAGCGQHLSSEHLVIDVERPKSGVRGRCEPKTVTNDAIHSAVTLAMKDLGLKGLRVRERLFVNGLHVQTKPDFLPWPKQPPLTWVKPGVLRKYALHPTPDARVYVCVEMPGWQGQLVVTLFVRAVAVGRLMYVEWRIHALPPLKRQFLQLDRYLGEARWRRRWLVAWRCAKKTPVALFGAPVRSLAGFRRNQRAEALRKRQHDAIGRGEVFDYGARQSVREEACGRGRQHLFLRRDEAMFVLLAQENLINSVRQFLDAMNVDTGQLDEQVKVILEHANKHYSTHLGQGDDAKLTPTFRRVDD